MMMTTTTTMQRLAFYHDDHRLRIDRMRRFCFWSNRQFYFSSLFRTLKDDGEWKYALHCIPNIEVSSSYYSILLLFNEMESFLWLINKPSLPSGPTNSVQAWPNAFHLLCNKNNMHIYRFLVLEINCFSFFIFSKQVRLSWKFDLTHIILMSSSLHCKVVMMNHWWS